MSLSDKGAESTEHVKGEKRRSEDAELDQVHSANNWEEANLGDNDRRSKFLRLMGANKKQHSGRFVIGDKSSKHGRSDDETSRLTRQLEHQYKSGLELKLSGAARHHSGLGFQPEERPALWSQHPTLPTSSEHPRSECKDKEAENSETTTDSPTGDDIAGSSTKGDATDGPNPSSADEKSQKQPNGKEDSAMSSRSLAMKLNFVKASS